jgi:hypothetical protein
LVSSDRLLPALCPGVDNFSDYSRLEAGSLSKAILLGALYGFFTYVTYDLTNLATLRD